MFALIARARKDAKALSYINERNYGGFLRVESLGGGRTKEEVLENLERVLEGPYIPVLLLGEKEKDLMEELLPVLREYGKPFYARVLRTKRVRNMRVDELYAHIEEIKARFRLGIEWNGTYALNPENPFGLEINPDYDIYLALGDGFRRAMRSLLDVELGENSLVLRKTMNQEVYYSGQNKVAEVSKKLGFPTEVLWKCPCTEDVSLDSLISANREYIEAFASASKAFLRAFEDYDIVVPWSGGKDSTATLILAKDVFDEVTAVYVRMEYEMPGTDEYVEKLAKRLGVELVRVDVPMPIEKYGMPTHQNRWCTRKKVEALYSVVSEFEKPVLLVGDRDGESARRRLKPPVVERKTDFGTFIEIMPIKFWSGFMVQLFVLMRGFKLHPLYYEGFYRLGCTICPSLADWEVKLLKRRGVGELPSSSPPEQG
ncbi:phosphoadenosine phosphosulfate reductase family protein [Thermococcus sp. AM4]|uniref:phosphoadenosine phosphosulfate reductase domain-containing protein n=1 Tax=Thermococcus sp. (strain AM4) TaxID=246969 RepID=UPI000229996D|nr:phosphoadenosine phosphosulfate reductase family protein [Thermococcus sp. AM4]AEO14015.1 3'-phosphoadenosine 5'-phosphosulfate sulfotransferase [Thermococcus sp. AM4]